MTLVETLLISIVSGGLTSAALLWLVKTWLTERIQQSIKSEYDHKLEGLKAELRSQHETAIERIRADAAQQRAMEAAASWAFTNAQKAAVDRRLSAIDTLWKETLTLREKRPAFVGLMDILRPTEYDRLVTEDRHKSLFADPARCQLPLEMLSNTPVDKVRPFLNERLYHYYFAYRALIGRVAYLGYKGYEAGHIEPWQQDKSIGQMLQTIFTPEEWKLVLLAGFEKEGRLGEVLSSIEFRMIKEASDFASGRVSADEGVEQAHRVVKALDALRRETPTLKDTPPQASL